MVNKKDKKERIMEAAAIMFAQKGFSGTVMEDISNRAGIGKGTLYGYFKSKDDLFFSLFESMAGAWIKELNDAIDRSQGPVTERLLSVNDEVLSMWWEIKDLFSLTMEFWAASSAAPERVDFKKAFKSLYGEMKKSVSALIQKGIDVDELKENVDARSIAASIVGFWDSMFLQAWFDRDFNPVQTGKSFMAVVVDGMKKNNGKKQG